MPYPNEHSCRIRNPGAFQDDSFRRIHQTADGKPLEIIIGRLKGKTTTTTQAFRYPKGSWSASEARRHCTAHEGILFEPATGETKENPKKERGMGITFQAQKYSVKTTTEPIGGEDGQRSFLARVDEADNSIVIDGTMPKSRQEECLFHELLHVTDFSLPENILASISRALYGLLRENNLLVPNILSRISDGILTKAQAEALNKKSNEMAQGPTFTLGRKAAVLFRISDAPWDGSASRYTIVEWRRATLIHLDGVDPDLKSSHKLPVKEPDGDISRNGCHAAAAVLGGGRGGVDAPPEKKRAAARALVRIYRNDLEEDPPESLTRLAGA